jgi:hypothetical protein
VSVWSGALFSKTNICARFQLLGCGVCLQVFPLFQAIEDLRVDVDMIAYNGTYLILFSRNGFFIVGGLSV